MSKTFAAILHYNTVKYTDAVYEMLKPYERDDYDLVVIDNGSDKDKISKYTTYTIDTNIYFGGGLDKIMGFILDKPEYDSVVTISSDMILHGNNFIRGLRKELFSDENLMVVAPCILHPEQTQCFWPAMHNWGSQTIRHVPWVDFQCSLLKRKLVEEIRQFGSKFGWAQDIYTGIVCEKMGWKIGVCDWIPAIHFSSATIKEHPEDPIISQYNELANQEMLQYFKDRNLWDKFVQNRIKGYNYTYEHNL
jgi:GT2 family glycosyltransferase